VMMVSMAGVGLQADDQRSLVLPVGRMVATPRPYPAGRADDVHRPGFNGRVWIGRTARSREGAAPEYALDWRRPGPAAYGAAEDDSSTAYIRIGHNIVGISPWETQSFSRLEEGRRQWLDERGFTGGVRTFVSDAALRQAGSGEGVDASPVAVRPAATDPEPLIIIELPEDQPRQKSRMRVDAGETPAPRIKAIGAKPVPTTAHRPSVVHIPSAASEAPPDRRVADSRTR